MTAVPANPSRASSGVRIALEVASQTLSPMHTGWLLDRINQVMRHLGLAGECRVRLVDDGEMSRVHEQRLGVPGTTDVITFDLSDPSDAGGRSILDVDLLLCVDEARRQASEAGFTVERELLLYVVHGVLHCLGYDDHNEDDARAMHEQEDRILTDIGVGPTYRRDHADHPRSTKA